MNDDYLLNGDVILGGAAQDVDSNETTTNGVGEDNEITAEQVSAEDSDVSELAREREMRVATEARYKSLQGQYDSFQRKQNDFEKSREETAQLRESHALMQAQLADMRELVSSKQAEPEEPIFDETLKGFLGEQSSGFEAALNRAAVKAATAVRIEADKKIAALSAQLADVQKKNQAVPFDMLRNSDSVYDEPGFAEFIAAEKDPIFGVSIKDQMAQMHAQGKDIIPAVKRARDLYVAKRGAAPEAVTQVVNPRIGAAGSSASKAPSKKADIKSLQAEYEAHVRENLAKDRPRRLEILKILAQNGVY